MRIAVIGAGISGIAAAHHLSPFAQTTLYEASDRIGGHTDTHRLTVDGRQYAIDTGFIVFNDENYPGFSAWLKELGVASKLSDMSFGVSATSGIEYGTADLAAVFCQHQNLLNPRFIGMLWDIRRFYRDASRLDPNDSRTMAQFLEEQHYGRCFVDDHIIPMCAALWSVPPAQAMQIPVSHVTAFMANHKMLQIQDRPQWRVVVGGSDRYVQAFRNQFSGQIRTGARVRHIQRDNEAVRVTDNTGTETYDHVVLACHSDQALSLLDATEAERAVLQDIRYEANRVVLHSDPSVMPTRKAAWSSWNVSAQALTKCSVTYWMNRLQGLDDHHQFFVSLNPEKPLRKVWAERNYAHPVFTPAARRAQARRPELNGQNRTWFCGAYWGWGFHEDGFQSAMSVVEQLRPKLRHAA